MLFIYAEDRGRTVLLQTTHIAVTGFDVNGGGKFCHRNSYVLFVAPHTI